MGYFINNIADETKTPAKVSLSDNPNFIQFESKGGINKPVEITINVIGKGFIWNIIESRLYNFTKFTIRETNTGIDHIFEATTDIDKIGGGTYYAGPVIDGFGALVWSIKQIAESLRNALLNNSFIGNNFNVIYDPAIDENGNISLGTSIKLISKGFGRDYAFSIIEGDPQLYVRYINVIGDPQDTINGDTISEDFNPVEIQMEVYSDTGVFLGQNDRPNGSNLGTFVKTLSKAYAVSPIWFNVNILDMNKHSIEFLSSCDWVNTNTVRDFRLIAKRFIDDDNRYENSIFYYSNILYQITGYGRNLEKNDLSEFVYDTFEGNIVRPLTNQPILTHIKGQTQYFNFILSDPNRNENLGDNEYDLGIIYRLYTQSKKFVIDVHKHGKNRKLFNIVNTIRLDIDAAIEDYDNIGIVEIYLSRSGHSAGYPLVFNILPECLYKVNDFAFLNSLGGWSSFNFAGTETTDFKASTNSIYKTQTPNHTISGEIESVYTKETDEQFIVQTMPIKKHVCDWLQELSSSVAVYEISSKRYVIVDELNIKSNTKDDLFRLEMKYHYSDRFNSLIV